MSKTSWDLIRPSFSVLLNEKGNEEVRGVEVGVAEGKNALLMLQMHPKLFLYLVDTDDNKVMREKLEPFKERFAFKCKLSTEASKQFEDKYFDYIYIDASHNYVDVLQDLNSWYGKIKEGGIIGGHDWWYDDVRKAVCEFFSGKGQQLYAVHNFCMGTVTSADAEMMDWWVRKR